MVTKSPKLFFKKVKSRVRARSQIGHHNAAYGFPFSELQILFSLAELNVFTVTGFQPTNFGKEKWKPQKGELFASYAMSSY